MRTTLSIDDDVLSAALACQAGIQFTRAPTQNAERSATVAGARGYQEGEIAAGPVTRRTALKLRRPRVAAPGNGELPGRVPNRWRSRRHAGRPRTHLC
jgi:hypothetical protein